MTTRTLISAPNQNLNFSMTYALNATGRGSTTNCSTIRLWRRQEFAIRQNVTSLTTVVSYMSFARSPETENIL